MERAARHHSWLSVAFIDIDRFKPINDTYGHNSGDAVLRQVASLIADNIRASDLFGRYGGEEFMLILPETQHDEAVVLAEKLRTLVANHRLVIAGNQHIQATISIGVAGDIGSQLQVDALVDQADAAMYAAKSLGRDRTYLFRAVDESAPVRRAPISADRRAAATAIGRWASDTADGSAGLGAGSAAAPPGTAVGHDRVAGDRHRPGDGAAARGDRAHPGRQPAARSRQAGGAARDPGQALRPVRRRMAGHRRAPAHRQLILEQASSLREAIPVVLDHHERFNGGGYPHGLRGNEIRWAPASWPWPMPTTPWCTIGRTRRRWTTTRR